MQLNFDGQQWREQRNKNLTLWMRGNYEAVAFLLVMFQIAETWDDLIDEDKVPAAKITEAFLLALYTLPSNAFWDSNKHKLLPVILTGINAWLDSNELETHTDRHSRVWAYALRDWYMELVAATAECVGGFQLMREISMDARAFFQAETLNEYLEKLT